MRLNKSKNLKLLKKEIGQANHMLITILVGLDGIADGLVRKREDFSTTWEPINQKESAERSKVFIKKSTLTWIVDNLHMYIRVCNEEPKLFRNQTLLNELDKNSRSVYLSFLALCKFYCIHTYNSALVDLLICWRNRLVHYKADNQIQECSRDILDKNKELILEKHNGLDLDIMLSRFDKSGVPSFKELASLVKAVIDFVYELDSTIIKNLNDTEYCNRILYKYISEKPKERLNNIFSKDIETKRRVITNVLKDYGYEDDGSTNESADQFISKVCSFSYKEALNYYKNGSFV